MKYDDSTESHVNLENYDDLADAALGAHRRDVRQLRVGDLAPDQTEHGVGRYRSERYRVTGEGLRARLLREKDELAEAILVLAGQLNRRERQLARLARYPEHDPFVDGTRLEFEKRFPGSNARYTYLALRAGGRWHVTGQRSPQNVDWSALVDFMGLGVDEVWKIGPRGGRKRVIGE